MGGFSFKKCHRSFRHRLKPNDRRQYPFSTKDVVIEIRIRFNRDFCVNK